MEAFISLFSQYNVPAAFLVNIELTLWSALFSTILGVILVMMRISPVASLRIVSGAYVELFKNLPLTIIMVFMVLGAYAQLKLSFSDTFATNFFWLEPVYGGVRMRIIAIRHQHGASRPG